MSAKRASVTIHTRIRDSGNEQSLSRSEIKRRLAALFALLLEMEIDQQNNVAKEYRDESSWRSSD